MNMDMNSFMQSKDFISESTLGPGETTVRMIGTCEGASITVSLDPKDPTSFTYTTTDKKVIMGRCLSKKE